MAGIDKSYIRQHILEYVRYQLKQGYVPEDIGKALGKMGYHKNLIDEVMHDITPGDIPAGKEPKSLKDMDKSLEIYVQNMLIDFIMKERKAGYEDPAIRRALLRFGHHHGMVELAFKEINTGEIVDLKGTSLIQINPQILLAVSMLIFFTFSVFLSISTNVTIVIVLLSLSPAAAAVLAAYFISLFVRHQLKQFLPLLGIVLALGGYMILIQSSPIMQKLPGSTIILVMNLAIAFILSAMFAFFSRNSEVEILEKASVRKKVDVMYDSQVKSP